MADAAARPNVIVIMVDDMGFSDIDEDGTELDDQAATNPEKLHERTGLYTEFAEEVGVVEGKELIDNPAGARFGKRL